MLVLITIAFFLIRVAPGGPFDSEKILPPEILAIRDAGGLLPYVRAKLATKK